MKLMQYFHEDVIQTNVCCCVRDERSKMEEMSPSKIMAYLITGDVISKRYSSL